MHDMCPLPRIHWKCCLNCLHHIKYFKVLLVMHYPRTKLQEPTAHMYKRRVCTKSIDLMFLLALINVSLNHTHLWHYL